jgi:hypothetical protein
LEVSVCSNCRAAAPEKIRRQAGQLLEELPSLRPAPVARPAVSRVGGFYVLPLPRRGRLAARLQLPTAPSCDASTRVHLARQPGVDLSAGARCRGGVGTAAWRRTPSENLGMAAWSSASRMGPLSMKWDTWVGGMLASRRFAVFGVITLNPEPIEP